LRKRCSLCGEEKELGSKEDPKKELSSKMDWNYNPAPYVLGKILAFHVYTHNIFF